jgi:hypothetical protein
MHLNTQSLQLMEVLSSRCRLCERSRCIFFRYNVFPKGNIVSLEDNKRKML